MDRGAQARSPMELRMELVQDICITLMWIFAFVDLFGGVASRNEDAPLRNIGNFPIWLVLYILFGAWALISLGFVGTSLYLARLRPIWALLHVVAVLLMWAFFPTYMHFEPFDFHIWGPIATNTGLLISISIKNTYFSPDRSLLRKVWNHINGSENRDEGNDMAMDRLDHDGRRSDSRRSSDL